MTQLSLKNISFSYKDTLVIDDFSLDVEKGSFTTLLGSSGCGKTTLLRLISGFLEPTCGEILIDGKNQKGIEVNRRKIGFVFQDYALFPHLTVRQNLLYGLKIQKKEMKDSSDSENELFEIAKILGLENLLERFPHELSGGQQQRVALGRSLILKPKILLMDEPLSSLDTKLRISVREELREIQQKVGITTIYVTHDQEEALSLSDKIAVLNEGKLIQFGSPKEIYFNPNSRFVAEFIGNANFIQKDGKEFMVRPDWFSLGKTGVVSTSSTTASLKFNHREETDIEPVEMSNSCSGFDKLNHRESSGIESVEMTGKIISSSFLGTNTRFRIQNEENQIFEIDLKTLECMNLKIGDEISISSTRMWNIPL